MAINPASFGIALSFKYFTGLSDTPDGENRRSRPMNGSAQRITRGATFLH
jgi:hypothetical protein